MKSKDSQRERASPWYGQNSNPVIVWTQTLCLFTVPTAAGFSIQTLLSCVVLCSGYELMSGSVRGSVVLDDE